MRFAIPIPCPKGPHGYSYQWARDPHQSPEIVYFLLPIALHSGSSFFFVESNVQCLCGAGWERGRGPAAAQRGRRGPGIPIPEKQIGQIALQTEERPRLPSMWGGLGATRWDCTGFWAPNGSRWAFGQKRSKRVRFRGNRSCAAPAGSGFGPRPRWP